MKKLILSLLMITMLTGCVSAPVKQEEGTTTNEDVVTTVETTELGTKVSVADSVEPDVTILKTETPETDNNFYDGQYDVLDEELSWTGENTRKKIFLENTDIKSLPDFVIDSCIENLNNDFTECESLFFVKTATYDMNNDGKEDYFVLPFPDKYPGNNIPPLYLFVMGNDNPTVINIPLKSDLFITVLNSQNYGYFDLQSDCFGNVLSFDGESSYKGEHILVRGYSVDHENDIICLRVSCPYRVCEYDKYYLKICFFDGDFKKVFIATSNDKEFCNIVYSKDVSVVNGEYCFYIEASDINAVDLEKMTMELKYVEVE